MINSVLLISILVFLSAGLAVAGAYIFISNRRERKKIIEKIRNDGFKLAQDHGAAAFSDKGQTIKQRVSASLTKLGEQIKNRKKAAELSSIRLKMLQAGYRKHNAPYLFFGFKTLLASALPVASLFAKILFLKALPSVHFVFILGGSALIGFMIPDLWLLVKTNARKEKLLEGFPDALDLLVVCVEAGMGLDAAINRVGDEMSLKNRTLSEEFRILGLELRAGMSRSDALRNLAKRTGLDDVSSLVTLLIQTDRFGTSVAQALRVHASSMRTRRFQKAEEIAAKLPVKLVFPLILFIFPSLFVVIAGPAVIRIARALLPAMSGQ